MNHKLCFYSLSLWVDHQNRYFTIYGTVEHHHWIQTYKGFWDTDTQSILAYWHVEDSGILTRGEFWDTDTRRILGYVRVSCRGHFICLTLQTRLPDLIHELIATVYVQLETMETEICNIDMVLTTCLAIQTINSTQDSVSSLENWDFLAFLLHEPIKDDWRSPWLDLTSTHACPSEETSLWMASISCERRRTDCRRLWKGVGPPSAVWIQSSQHTAYLMGSDRFHSAPGNQSINTFCVKLTACRRSTGSKVLFISWLHSHNRNRQKPLYYRAIVRCCRKSSAGWMFVHDNAW